MSIGEGDIAVLKYDLAQWQIDEISVIRAVSDETILIGSKTSGLWQYDVRTQTAHQIFFENYVRDILCYSSSVCWIATENGIYLYDINSHKVEHWRKDPHDVFAIQDHAIYSFIRIVKEESGVAAISGDFRMFLTASVSSKVSNRVRNTPGLRERLSGSSAKMRMAIYGLEQKIMD